MPSIFPVLRTYLLFLGFFLSSSNVSVQQDVRHALRRCALCDDLAVLGCLSLSLYILESISSHHIHQNPSTQFLRPLHCLVCTAFSCSPTSNSHPGSCYTLSADQEALIPPAELSECLWTALDAAWLSMALGPLRRWLQGISSATLELEKDDDNHVSLGSRSYSSLFQDYSPEAASRHRGNSGTWRH